MVRDLTAGMQTEVAAQLIRPVWIVRLDIENDPILAWTGRGDFMPTGTGDAALDGFTFTGLGPIDAISNIKDALGGSQAVTLTLPGVDLQDDALRQVVLNSETWQFRQAWIWFGLLNASYGVIADPTRIKTGRMDQMKINMDGQDATVSLIVESFQSYAQEKFNSRYIQQPDIDAMDESQKFVHDLANKQPVIDNPTPQGSTGNLTGGATGRLGGFNNLRLR